VADRSPNALLLKRYRDDILNATAKEISQAALDTVPRVAPLFWSFRIMVAIGFYLIAFFAAAFWFACKHNFQDKPWFLKMAAWSLPLPWIAIECGWFIAEYGRQPWAVEGVLPTFYAASGLALHDILLTLFGFVAIYTTLMVIEIKLMLKSIRRGPDELAPPLPKLTPPSVAPNNEALAGGQG
jgi:cytochrome d ubiquinol oxidase subunit I